MGCKPSKPHRLPLEEEKRSYAELHPESRRKPSRKVKLPWNKSNRIPEIIISKVPDPRTRITANMTAYDLRVFGDDSAKAVAKTSNKESVAFGSIAGSLLAVPERGLDGNIKLSNAHSPHRSRTTVNPVAVTIAPVLVVEKAVAIPKICVVAAEV